MEARLQLAQEEVETALDKNSYRDGYRDMEQAISDLTLNAKGHVITNDMQNAQATEMLNSIKKYMKDAKAKRDTIIKPLDVARKAADKLYHEVIDPLEAAEDHLKKLVGDYFVKRETERRRLQAIEDERDRKAQEKHVVKAALAEKKGITAPLPPPVTIVQAPEKTVKVESGASANVQMEWKAEIVSEADVPREFCIPSMPKINAAIKLGARSIPGVRIFEQPKISVRTN